jgi:hypothetical protein
MGSFSAGNVHDRFSTVSTNGGKQDAIITRRSPTLLTALLNHRLFAPPRDKRPTHWGKTRGLKGETRGRLHSYSSKKRSWRFRPTGRLFFYIKFVHFVPCVEECVNLFIAWWQLAVEVDVSDVCLESS